jgi:hypothetical protein
MIKRNYVDNKKLLDSLIDYKKRKQKNEQAQIDNYTAECIMIIAEEFSKRKNFRNYSYRDEMVLDAIENVITYIDNFDPEKSSNPFSYITQITYYSFIRRIQKEKTQVYVRFKSIQKNYLNNNLADFQDLDYSKEGYTFSMEDPLYENMQEFIDKYEHGVEQNKKKVESRKTEKGVLSPNRKNKPILKFDEGD